MKTDICPEPCQPGSVCRTCWSDLNVLHPYQALVQRSSSKGLDTETHQARVSEQVSLCQSGKKGLKQPATFMVLCIGLSALKALLSKGSRFTSWIP